MEHKALESVSQSVGCYSGNKSLCKNDIGNLVPPRIEKCDAVFVDKHVSPHEIHRQLTGMFGDGVMRVR